MKLHMTQKSLAAHIGMSYRHFNRLLNTTCKFPINAEFELEKELGYERSFISNLRIAQIEFRQKDEIQRNDLKGKQIPLIRRCVFWDVNPDNLDWSRHREFIMTRVNNYGNEQEKKDVSSFYKL